MAAPELKELVEHLLIKVQELEYRIKMLEESWDEYYESQQSSQEDLL